MGLECTTWRPAIHFSASFHLDGTCCRKNGADTATVVAGTAALSSLQNSKLPPAPAPFSMPLSLPLPPQLRLRAALPWLASERDREESDRWSLGYSAGRRRSNRSLRSSSNVQQRAAAAGTADDGLHGMRRRTRWRGGAHGRPGAATVVRVWDGEDERRRRREVSGARESGRERKRGKGRKEERKETDPPVRLARCQDLWRQARRQDLWRQAWRQDPRRRAGCHVTASSTLMPTWPQDLGTKNYGAKTCSSAPITLSPR